MPRPPKHVFICAQARPPGHPRGSCAEKGCRDVLDEFLYQFQQRQCFDKVAITQTGCLGPCSIGTNVLVYPEGVMYSAVSKEDVNAIFDEHLLGGVPVERLKAPAEFW
ncbi:MAG: (2Fe-2S) ferredoxin domain-containing protein [Betaproteobacteria bacterium]|nr:(2Fe-2S) ferredoxin domain-containing protein [Betaproteobacteria bacterium]